MNNQNEVLSCEQAKKLDLVEYLHSLGHQPKRIRGVNYWYLSPLRVEKTPSFKVDRKRNLWYDHGIGQGGTLIDFGIQYHCCSVPELLRKLSKDVSFQQPLLSALHGEEIKRDNSYQKGLQKDIKDGEKDTINITAVLSLTSLLLQRYVHQRNIPLALAKTWLKEVYFSLGERTYTALGFRNGSGGYELRNPKFKGSASPKDITLIKREGKNLYVFEGFFDFLSFLSLHPQGGISGANFLVLNSLSFIEKSKTILDCFERVSLLLDRDEAGRKQTEILLSQSNKYQDESGLYRGYKDLNDWVRHMGKRQSVYQKHRFT